MTEGGPGRTVRTVTDVRRPAPAFALPDWVRVVLPAVVAAVFQVGITTVAGRHQPDAGPLDAFGVVLLLAGPAALLMRRSRPVLTLAVAFVASMTYWLIDYPRGPVFIALGIAFINARLRGHRVAAWTSLVAGYVITAWIAPALVDDGPWPNWGAVAALAAWLLALAAVTELANSWLERSAERAQTQAEEARRRASEERLRIARELHDVLAHNISLINVRAGVALHLVDERPDQIEADQVRPALAAIKDASKDALGELRSVLDVLRYGDDGAVPLAPTAGLGDLDALVDRARGTGLDVRIEPVDATGAAMSAAAVVDGLPAGVDLAAFRVAQEALTNVVRHAGATRATVRLRRTDDALEVQVDDDGDGAAAAAGGPRSSAFSAARSPLSGGIAAKNHGDAADRAATRTPHGDVAGADAGRGITGMRERALALGGTLDAGPRPGRGFRVRARFPLRGDA